MVIGLNTSANNTKDYSYSAIGTSAQAANIVGANNTVIGYLSLYFNTANVNTTVERGYHILIRMDLVNSYWIFIFKL